ncbi:hypothetical protein FQN54_001779 [Arachnomyces sp. PD_36]|nr:hypothetical protein FQN54_001779 [Arachnomyces sp. PD_36]
MRSRSPGISVLQPSVEQFSTEDVYKVEERDHLMTHQDEDGKILSAERKRWKPFYLSGLALCGFVATFVAIIIGLAILYTQSRARNGIATTDSNLHYLWTFGPTALFTVILVFWGLLEYQTKLLAPWHAMNRGVAPARNTIFLDFISPWNVLVLPKAISNRQPVPFLAIAGSLLIRLLVVASTGLLVSETVSLTSTEVSLATTQKWVPAPDFHPRREDSRAIRIVTAAQKWNLSYPLGTYPSYALPTIDMSKTSLPADAVVSFDADVFTADIQCEVGPDYFTFSMANVNKEGYPKTRTTVDVPGTGVSLTCSGPDYGYSVGVGCPYLNVSFPGCDNPVEFETYFNMELSDGLIVSSLASSVESYPHRCKEDAPPEYVGIMTNTLARPSLSGFEVEFTALLCKPRYSMRRRRVSTRNNRLTPDSLSSLANDIDVGGQGLLANLSVMDLYKATGPAWQLPEDTTQMNATFTKNFVVERFEATAAQLAKLYFMAPSDESVIGDVTHNEERLLVREFPFIFMEVLLVLLTCICLALWFLSSRHLCPREPGSIGGLATILARSSLMMKLFSGTSNTPLHELCAGSTWTSYHTTTGPDEGGSSFSIVPSGEIQMNPLLPKEQSIRPSKWWRPVIVRTPSKIGVVLCTVGLIVALEVLNQYSSSHNGIMAIQMGEYVKYSWVYIPTLTMVAVNVVYNMLDFAATVFQPYTLLRNGGPNTGKVMLEDLLGGMALITLVSSLSKRQIAVPATKLAVIAGSMLSIAVSGLYTARSVPFDQQLPLSVAKDFRLDWPLAKVGTNQESYIENLPAILVLDHAPYPKWTHDEFVFPQLTLATNDTTAFTENSTSIHARVPALRGEMNCTMFNFDYDVKFDKNATGDGWMPNNGAYIIAPKQTQPGCNLEVVVDVYPDNAYYGIISNYRPQDPECPTYAMSVGFVDRNIENANISMAHCSPYLEQSEVDVTFTDSNFTIDTTQPPRVVPGTSTVYGRHEFISIDSFYMYFDTGLSTPSSDNKNHGYDRNLDFLFNALVKSGRVSSVKDLMGPRNADRLLQETSRLYGITVAQVLNSEFHPEDDDFDNTPEDKVEAKNGTISRTEYRLVQSAISTHILAGLLVFMLLCAAAAYLSMRTRDILPNDPCSIAAKASLLASSKILSEEVIPSGSEWLSNEQLRMNGIFGDGSRFRLKWWDGERYGIDVESDDDT